MITIYQAETTGRIKLSDDLDCLPADARRIETLVFPSNVQLFRHALAMSQRGFSVCVDTETIDCYEYEPYTKAV